MRVFVRLLSLVLGLALAALGLLPALEVAWHWWRPEDAPLLVPWPSWRESLLEAGWNSAVVRLAAALVMLLGLVLMIAALAARRRDIRLHDPATEVSVTTSPRALARLVGRHVRAQDNITGATVTASRRRVRVRARSTLEAEHEVRPRVAGSVSALLADIPLVTPPKVSVVVDSPKDRR